MNLELEFSHLRAVSELGHLSLAVPPAGFSWPVTRSGPVFVENVLPGQAACLLEGMKVFVWLLPTPFADSLQMSLKSPLRNSGSEDSVTGVWSARDRWADLRGFIRVASTWCIGRF